MRRMAVTENQKIINPNYIYAHHCDYYSGWQLRDDIGNEMNNFNVTIWYGVWGDDFSAMNLYYNSGPSWKTNTFLDIPTLLQKDILTLSFWIQVRNIEIFTYWLMGINSSANYNERGKGSFVMSVEDGIASFYLNDSSTPNSVFQLYPNNTQWHHICLRLSKNLSNSGEINFYSDGELKKTVNYNINSLEIYKDRLPLHIRNIGYANNINVDDIFLYHGDYFKDSPYFPNKINVPSGPFDEYK